MSTNNRPLTPAQKRGVKTLLCLVTVLAFLATSMWMSQPVDELAALADLKHEVHTAHLSNFNWMSALSMAHEH